MCRRLHQSHAPGHHLGKTLGECSRLFYPGAAALPKSLFKLLDQTESSKPDVLIKPMLFQLTSRWGIRRSSES